MDKRIAGVVENILDLTESEDSSSLSNHQLINSSKLDEKELHEIKKGNLVESTENTSQNKTNLPPEIVTKKRHKLKKKGYHPAQNRSNASESSSSLSDTSAIQGIIDEKIKEEFYDAHESYHSIPVNNLMDTAAVTLDTSVHVQDPKTIELAPNQVTTTTVQPSSAITKPVNPPD